MSLIFFKGPRKEQQQLRAQWNCVFEQVTWLRDIIYTTFSKRKRHTKKKQQQCGRLSLPSIYRDSCCCSIREDGRYTLLLVLVVVDIKDWRGDRVGCHKRGADCHRAKKKAHTHTHVQSQVR